jgi:hypothetical protein
MSGKKQKSLTKEQRTLLAAMLKGEKRAPLSLNPSEKGEFVKTAAEHKLAVGQGTRKRRNDALYNLLAMATSPMGTSR